MSWWYPQLNVAGHIVSGNGEVWLDGAAISTGHSPQWHTDQTVLIDGDAQGARLLNVVTGEVEDLHNTFNARVGNTSGICAGAGRWCGWNAGGLVYDGALVDAAAAPGAIDKRTGALYYLTPYQSDHRDVVLDGQIVKRSLATEIVAGEACATWGEYTPRRTLFGWAPETGIVYLSPLPVTELLFVGVPVRTPTELWVVAQTHKGLIVFPWGGATGYILEQGEWFYHDARWINGQIRIVATSNNGSLRVTNVDLSTPRVDLSDYRPTTGTPDPPVDPLPSAPHCTITQFPPSVTLGDPIVCTAEYSGGPAEVARWTSRMLGVEVWTTEIEQRPPQLTFDYAQAFSQPGSYDIRLAAEGPGGSDETTATRRITVEERRPPVPPQLKVPQVTVDRWTLDDVLEGREFTFHDAANPDLGYAVRVWVEDGSMKARITNTAGSGQTGLQRIVKPCSQGPDPIDPPEPELPMGLRPVSFGPNLGSPDFCTLFTEDNLWTGWKELAGFHFFGQNVLPIMQELVGPNTYDNLKEAQAFSKCKAWGLATEMELAGGPEQAYEAEAKIAAAGGRLDVLAYDDTFKEGHISVSEFAGWVREYRQTHPKWIILVYAAFPSNTVTDIINRFRAWIAMGAHPDVIRLDVDPGKRTYSQADHVRLRAFCDEMNEATKKRKIGLQYVVNAKDGLSSAEYCKQADAYHQKMEALGEWDGRILQSWAEAPDHTRQIPVNLREGDAAAFTTLLKKVLQAAEIIERPVPPVSDLVPLVTDGRFFRLQTGEPYTVIETTEISLFKRFLDGEPIDPILDQRASLGFNTLRVWLLNKSVVGSRNQVHDEGIHPNQYPDFYTKLTAFCNQCGHKGLRLELTAFTSTHDNPGDPGLMPDEGDQQRHWQRTQDAVRGLPNVMLELVNEADQYNNATTATLTKATGILCSRGSNGSDSVPPGHADPWDYELYHIIGSEWQRKTGHNAMEWADQSGHPCFTGETQRYPDKETSTTRAYDSAAGCALLAAGVNFHSQGGKYSRLFDATELAAAEATVAGARSVPLEFQRGAYQHHQDRENSTIVRSYSRTLGDGRRHYVDIRY